MAKVNNRGSNAAAQKANRRGNNTLVDQATDDDSDDGSDDGVDNNAEGDELANQQLLGQLVDRYLLDPRLFDLDLPIDQLSNRMSPYFRGPLLPQIGLVVAGKPVNPPLNQAVNDAASQPVQPTTPSSIRYVASQPASPLVDELVGRPVRHPKRSRLKMSLLLYRLVRAKDRRKQVKIGQVSLV